MREQCYYSDNKSHTSYANVYRDGFGVDVYFMTVQLVNAAKEEISGFDLGDQYESNAFDSDLTCHWASKKKTGVLPIT